MSLTSFSRAVQYLSVKPWTYQVDHIMVQNPWPYIQILEQPEKCPQVQTIEPILPLYQRWSKKYCHIDAKSVIVFLVKFLFFEKSTEINGVEIFYVYKKQK